MIDLAEAHSLYQVPPGDAGLTVGLFGGSFNPPHDGHFHVALTALRRLGLDRIWWLVTPGNPLKDHSELEALEARVAAVRRLADHPRFTVTAFEATEGLSYSADTIAFLRRRRPGVNFVWVMGADNLAGFHRWQFWRQIVDTLPIAIVDRPGASLSPLFAPMAEVYRHARIAEDEAGDFALRPAPAWTFLHAPLNPLSSTLLRQHGPLRADR
ncbi:nicotinate-nucleotide adenylyltransferase [Rhodobium gokarnense]|uniref:Probable nicotinate-nucleotide adenylyltransferase n=1 Tax=Rhodobium gokarnense TaxID=364296 RepID=A0ABT3HEJ7_9HYPH|nr:nicotinate-nucleotide adenylyltransferase [Rhodobium gokarnense]MCW2308818.1 nicotinate-nucleotide adenylyltransferase [Rhodobium gokarnense]